MAGIKTITGVGTTTGRVKASSASDEVVFNGSFYAGADLQRIFSHQDLVSGVYIAVTAGKAFQVIVNATFADDAEATAECVFEEAGQHKKILLSGDATPPGVDFEIAQFHIYA